MSKEKLSVSNLPILERTASGVVYDANDTIIQEFLRNQWTSGFNPLIQVAGRDLLDRKLLRLKVGDSYIDYAYLETGDTFLADNKKHNPRFLSHHTKSGWIELALENHSEKVGSWAYTYSSRGPWGMRKQFPPGSKFLLPSDRFVELIFNAETILKEIKHQTNGSDYRFEEKLPLSELVPSSKAYLKQVMGFNAV